MFLLVWMRFFCGMAHIYFVQNVHRHHVHRTPRKWVESLNFLYILWFNTIDIRSAIIIIFSPIFKRFSVLMWSGMVWFGSAQFSVDLHLKFLCSPCSHPVFVFQSQEFFFHSENKNCIILSSRKLTKRIEMYSVDFKRKEYFTFEKNKINKIDRRKKSNFFSHWCSIHSDKNTKSWEKNARKKYAACGSSAKRHQLTGWIEWAGIFDMHLHI